MKSLNPHSQLGAAYYNLLNHPNSMGAIDRWDSQILWSDWQGDVDVYHKLVNIFGKKYTVTMRDQIVGKHFKPKQPVVPEGHVPGEWNGYPMPEYS